MKASGRWIETAGFVPRSRVRITVEHQRLALRQHETAKGRKRPFALHFK
ncbi:hypothetical protein [Paraburkholderia kururiensis]